MRISVICPSYNRASFLEECIAPVMAIPDAEFILVDDGSTDGTLEFAHILQERFGEDRIVVIPLGGNQGAQVARNRGMEQARGEMILFCDSDDVVVSSGVKDLAVALTQNLDLNYAYGRVLMTDEDLNPLEGVGSIGSTFEDSPYEMAGYHWHTMGALYRKSYLEKVGPWNPALTGSQDWEFQARVKLAGGKGLFVDTLVGYWRQHEGGRVGARKFRPDYVRSVVTACDVILSGARVNGKCDRSLQRRLAKKLIIHALESGAHGDQSLRRICLSHAATAVLGDPRFSLAIKGIQLSPSWFDEMIWNRLYAK
jgi:glycosyltransferase involved in cell wall biosynthesis